MYNQSCHYGFLFDTEDMVEVVNGNRIIQNFGIAYVRCDNPICPAKDCRFSHYTKGEIPDEECPFYVENHRDKIGDSSVL